MSSILRWFRKRKYDRLNRELAAKGIDDRFVEVIKGEWYRIGKAHLEKPIPPVRDVRKVYVSKAKDDGTSPVE